MHRRLKLRTTDTHLEQFGGVRAENEVRAWLVSEAFSPPAKVWKPCRAGSGELSQEALTGPQSRTGGKGYNGAKACRWWEPVIKPTYLSHKLFVVILDVLDLLENQDCLSN